MAVNIIVAVAENGVIGKDNTLIWSLPNDMRHFVQSTKGHPVIMGRKTYESMGKPLPGRPNFIVTRNKDIKIEGCSVHLSLNDALESAKQLDEDVYIIGGAEIYRQSQELTDVMLITRVHDKFDGDTFFEVTSPSHWKLVSAESHQKDERHQQAFTIERYERIV